MSKQAYECSDCGANFGKWMGRCPKCQTWGSIQEVSRVASIKAPTRTAVPIGSVPIHEAAAIPTQIGELDRVLGGGLVPGSVVLLTGEPGIGKSTLLLSVAATWAESGGSALYVSGEESTGQIRLRAERTSAVSDHLYVATETDLNQIVAQIESVNPTLTIVDSIQTLATSEVDGVLGGVSQVRAITAALVSLAKARNMSLIIVGHVTKDGNIAGPRTMEHLVDVVLNFEGDKQSGFRMVRSSKNRCGPADEVGCFTMTETGIEEVPDPSDLFTSRRNHHVAGTCLTVSLEGRRPMLTELQALVVKSNAVSPRRVTAGVESSRVAMMLAVLQRKTGQMLHNKEVYLSTVGGARVQDPALDAAMCVALASSVSEKRLPDNYVVLGEVALSGEIRKVPNLQRRLEQAARLGVTRAVVPLGSDAVVPNLQCIEVGSITELLFALGLLSQKVRRAS